MTQTSSTLIHHKAQKTTVPQKQTDQLVLNQRQTGLPTPIKVTNLAILVHGFHKAQYLIEGFTYGFKLGVQGQIQTKTYCNHNSVLNAPGVVNTHLQKEMNLSRISGPHSFPPFKPFVISPLGLVPKKEVGEFRLIHDLSYPRQQSVNSHIPDELRHVHYETLDDLVELVKIHGRGSLIAKADIESAFRIIPIHPSDHYLLGFTWNDKFFYDKRLPMGCSTSCNIFESFSTAIQWILKEKLGVKFVSHILDDFMFVGPSNSEICQKSLNTFLALSEHIGIPIKASKTCQPSTRAIVHGVTLDTEQMELSLPDDKCETILEKLSHFMTRKKCRLKELQSLIGSLNFACLIVVPGRAFLRRLTDLTRGVTRPHHFIKLNNEARADIRAWYQFISHFNGKCLFLQDRWISSEKICFYTDAASTFGYAAIFGGKWFAGKWPENWKKFHITVMEMYPITAAVETWVRHLRNHCILFFSDNQAVVDIISKLTSKDKNIMILVRRLIVCAMKFNFLFRAKHIPGVHNVTADLLSRFQFTKAKQQAPWLEDQQTVIVGL